MTLPNYKRLQINNLVAIFNKTTNSYKFFWMLGILNIISNTRQKIISLPELVIEMISSIWFPVNYYNLSLGKQDRLYQKIVSLKQEFNIPLNSNKQEIANIFNANITNQKITTIIRDVTRYVPFRLLSPWYSKQLFGKADFEKNKIIESLSNSSFNELNILPIYKINSAQKEITINDDWYDYILLNINILTDFTYWHLVKYLERKNPNIPNISQKLFEPIRRNLQHAKNYWKKVLEKSGWIKCIYSQEIITIDNFSIDHYIPWSFVAHDQIWNLIPTTQEINSSKGNNLPANFYLDEFVFNHYKAFMINASQNPKNEIFDDYILLFDKNFQELKSMRKDEFCNLLKSNILPLIQIAENSGFNSNWQYSHINE